MTYIVEWDQWFRCGRYGDDTDYTTETREFDALHKAELFVESLVEGKFRGRYDMKVYRNEVKIIQKS